MELDENMSHFYYRAKNGRVVMRELTVAQGHKQGLYKSASAVVERIPKKSDLSYMFAENAVKASRCYTSNISRISQLLYGIVFDDRGDVHSTSEWGIEGHKGLEDNDTSNKRFGAHVKLRNELFERENIHPIECERKVISDDLRLGGTVDVIFRDLDGNYGILDYKFRGKSMQARETDCAQIYLYGEMVKEPISRYINLVFDRLEPKYNWKEWSAEEVKENGEVALLANSLYNRWADKNWPVKTEK